MLHHDRSRVIPQERWRACADLIEHDAERVNVATFVARGTHDLFRRRIEWCANLPATRVTRNNSEQFEYAEVSDDGFTYCDMRRIVFIEQNICWFELTVYYTMPVSILNCRPD